ncbi:Evi5 protein, partial [Globisporangium splendens]
MAQSQFDSQRLGTMAMEAEGDAAERPKEAACPLAEVLGVLVDTGCVEADAIDAIAQLNRSLCDRVKKLKLRRRVVRKHGFPAQSRFQWMCAVVAVARVRSYWKSCANVQQLIDEIPPEVSASAFYLQVKLLEMSTLGNVLKAVALHANDIGYCQGMNYVAAALLLMLNEPDQDSEEREPFTTSNPPQVKTFWMLYALIRNHGMADIWRSKMPGEFFRQNPKLQLEQLHIDELLSSALSFKITRKSLQKMEDERNLEYLRLRLQKTPLSHEHSMLFPNLDDNESGHNQKETLNFIRSQLEHFDDDVASDTVVLRQKIEGIDKSLVQATASLYTSSYALTEATFELEDHLEVKQRLRAQFQALSAIAIAEATAPSPSSLSGDDDLRRRKSLQFWSPAETLAYINSRMYGCFERATRLSMLSTRNSSKQEEDFDEHEAEQREQERRTLSHLEILVPRLAADLKAIQKKIDANDLELHGVQQRYFRLQSEYQLAKVRVEELQQFKDRLSDQMVQLMLETERLKNSKMQQLFAQVDEVNETRES